MSDEQSVVAAPQDQVPAHAPRAKRGSRGLTEKDAVARISGAVSHLKALPGGSKPALRYLRDTLFSNIDEIELPTHPAA